MFTQIILTIVYSSHGYRDKSLSFKAAEDLCEPRVIIVINIAFDQFYRRVLIHNNNISHDRSDHHTRGNNHVIINI